MDAHLGVASSGTAVPGLSWDLVMIVVDQLTKRFPLPGGKSLLAVDRNLAHDVEAMQDCDFVLSVAAP